MKNIVSFETAKRLKDAGFPQPVPEFGQGWYRIADGRLLLITGAQGPGKFSAVDASGHAYCQIFLVSDLIFAATATDILWFLKPGWTLAPGGELEYFACVYMPDPAKVYCLHPNAAEACAAAYFRFYAS